MIETTKTYYPISNDRMFAAVLASDPDLARKMIETILDIQIDHVVCVNAQQILNYNVDVKSVRFDVYIRDREGVIYDVEMQASPANWRWLPKRARYYGSVIDAESVRTGTYYRNIKNIYVIFICMYDPFNRGLARYTGKTMCAEDRDVEIETGITYIFLNASAVMKNVSKELEALLNFIAGKEETPTDLTRALQCAVDRYNKDDDWRRWNMTFEEELNDARDEGLEKGMEKGKVLGGQMMLENINFAFDLFREGKTDEEVFQSGKFSSLDEITEFRRIWESAKV